MVSKVLDQLEAIARWLQLKYMADRRTTEVVEPHRIRFHPQDCQKQILADYKTRLQKLKLK